jgi:guanylate kinase
MAEVTPTSGTDDQEALAVLRAHTGENCTPSDDSILSLQATDLLLVAGQFVGAGKSTLIKSLDQRFNIASYTNRNLRPGELEGVDKKQRTLAEMAFMAIDGAFLELEEVRPGCFYATPAEFKFGFKYVKDLELKGALRLREFAPDLKTVVPLPPLRKIASGVTEWERRVILRENMLQGISEKATQDLSDRLEGVVEESDRILELNLVENPNTLIVVNDDLPKAVQAMRAFVETGTKPDSNGVAQHIARVRELAATALQAA